MAKSEKHQGKVRTSLYSRVLFPMMLMAVLELGILVFSLIQGGLFNEIRSTALEVLAERTENKVQLLLDSMQGRWSDLSGTADRLENLVEGMLAEHGLAAGDMRTSPAVNAEIMQQAAPLLLAHMRGSGTTGAFMVLNGIGVQGQEQTWSGVYLRDADPSSNPDDNSDVLLVRGLPPVSRTLGVPLDSYWEATFTFDDKRGEYFTRPLAAAMEGRGASGVDYGLWCGPFTVSEGDKTSVITYSLPLFASDGSVLGVFGIEVTTNHITSVINTGELARQQAGCYLLAYRNGDDFTKITSGGRGFRTQFRSEQALIRAESWIGKSTMILTGSVSHRQLYGSVHELPLYSAGTAYSGLKPIVLIGMETVDSAQSTINRFIRILGLSAVVALITCVLVALAAGRSVTRPISGLVRELQTNNAHLHRAKEELTLTETGIEEIDILADSILAMDLDVHETSKRLETILQLTGTSVGVFELRDDIDLAFCSSGFFLLFDEPYDPKEIGEVRRARCQEILTRHLTDKVDDGVWRVRTSRGDRYVRVRRLQQAHGLIGAIMDVTEEMKNRYRIEHERDYDVLTDMLNRRAFSRIGSQLFTGTHARVGQAAAVVMMDLDNLKFINDTYGHDSGDIYIKTFAETIEGTFGRERAICARRSGDEFFVLLYGWEDRGGLEEHIRNCWGKLVGRTMQLLDGVEFRLRASAGVAWYPDDADDLETLIKYADFAMYKVKQGSKGTLVFFDQEEYRQDAFMLSAREALNRMVEEGRVRYHFQPLVDCRTGAVMGYELLMRPQVEELSRPAAVLRLAKSQGMLHHVERMTWFCALRDAAAMRDAGFLPPEARLFINSIADQQMDEDEEELMKDTYPDLLQRVVMEITESESKNVAFTRHKIEAVRGGGAMVAIDDFGTGYNSELALVQLDCDYVKIDISFVRNVDTNTDKQDMIRNLISYARRRGVKVLAEGVETLDEMRVLMDFGVDYLQGFLMGRPTERPMDIPDEVRREMMDYRRRIDS